MPIRVTACAVSSCSRLSKPALVLATSVTTTGRPASSMTATARVSLWVSIPASTQAPSASNELADRRCPGAAHAPAGRRGPTLLSSVNRPNPDGRHRRANTAKATAEHGGEQKGKARRGRPRAPPPRGGGPPPSPGGKGGILLRLG